MWPEPILESRTSTCNCGQWTTTAIMRSLDSCWQCVAKALTFCFVRSHTRSHLWLEEHIIALKTLCDSQMFKTIPTASLFSAELASGNGILVLHCLTRFPIGCRLNGGSGWQMSFNLIQSTLFWKGKDYFERVKTWNELELWVFGQSHCGKVAPNLLLDWWIHHP